MRNVKHAKLTAPGGVREWENKLRVPIRESKANKILRVNFVGEGQNQPDSLLKLSFV